MMVSMILEESNSMLLNTDIFYVQSAWMKHFSLLYSFCLSIQKKEREIFILNETVVIPKIFYANQIFFFLSFQVFF